MPSRWSWNAGKGIDQLCQLALWPMNSKVKMGANSPCEKNMNDDIRSSHVTGIAEFLFQQKRSQTQHCIPAHLLAFLFMRLWSFGSVLPVRLNQIKSHQIHPFGSSGSSGTTCPLPGCWDRRPTSQTWSGLGCPILLAHWCHDVIRQVVRSCNSAKKWSQFVLIYNSFLQKIYIGKSCSMYTVAITLP